MPTTTRCTADDSDSLSGGSESDTLFGDEGNDRLAGDGQTDTLYGGDGIDTLDGGSGSDRLFGDGGDDTFIGSSQNDTMDGGSGTDTVIFTGSADGYEASVVGGNLVITDTDTVGGDDGVNTLISVENLSFVGGGLPENLITINGSDRTISDYNPESGDQLVFLGINSSDISIDYIKGGGSLSNRFVTDTVIEVDGGPTITLQDIYVARYAQG